MTTTLYTHVDIEIPRPAEEVWAVVTDYATDTVWRKGITEMTPDRDGPPQVGTNVREVLQLGGRQYVTDTAVTEVGPGMSYRFAGTGTSGVVRGRRSVTPATTPDTAVFTYDVELEPHSIPRIARPILRWWLQHSLRRDLRRLRTLITSRPVTAQHTTRRAVVASTTRPPLPRLFPDGRSATTTPTTLSRTSPTCSPTTVRRARGDEPRSTSLSPLLVTAWRPS